MKLLDHMAVLFLLFWGMSTLFFIATVPIYNPTNSTQGSLFSTALSTLICCLFDDRHCDKSEEVSHCSTVILCMCFFLYLNWNIFDLVLFSFRCTAKWISFTYKHVHSFFRLFSHIGNYRLLNKVPCTIQ